MLREEICFVGKRWCIKSKAQDFCQFLMLKNWRRLFFGCVGRATKFGLGKNPHLRTLSVSSHGDEPKDFGDIIEAGHMFPFWESRAEWWEECRSWSWTSILVWVLYVHVYDRKVKMQFFKHFGGRRLKGKTEVFLKPDAASELTNAASRLCWKISPSIARTLQSCD